MLFSQNDRHPFETLLPVINCAEVIALQDKVKSVRFDKSVAEYILRLAAATREDPRLRLGISPRGSLTLYRTAQARAWTEGRDHVLPEDIKALAVPVLAHRLMLETKAKYGGALSEHIIEEALDKIPVPR
jgi:MoxR-like ATPase